MRLFGALHPRDLYLVDDMHRQGYAFGGDGDIRVAELGIARFPQVFVVVVEPDLEQSASHGVDFQAGALQGGQDLGRTQVRARDGAPCDMAFQYL